MRDALQEFVEAATRHGLQIDHTPIADGEIHRVPTTEDRGSNKTGWYVLHQSSFGICGTFGDWRTNQTQKWRGGDASRTDPATIDALNRVMAEQRQKVEAAKAITRERAIAEIDQIRQQARIFNAGDGVEDLPYLRQKGFTQCPSEVWLQGRTLFIPVYDASWRVVNLQSIYESNGKTEKRWHPGATRDECWMAVPGKSPWGSGTIAIAEGYATAASMAAASGIWTIAAGGTAKIEQVAMAIRKEHPHQQIIIVADDDRDTAGNPGTTKAQQAARKVNGIVLSPSFGPDRGPKDTDLNDQHVRYGLQNVAQTVQRFLSEEEMAAVVAQQAVDAFTDALKPKPLWPEGADPHFDERPVLIYRDQGKNGRDPFAPNPIPLMHLGISAMLSGVGGGGKTHLAARLAVCVVAGGEWLREQASVDADPRASKATYGWFVDESMAGGVLWVGAEESAIEMGRRIWKACRFNADGSEANEAEKIRRRDLVAKRLRVVALQDTPAEGERLVRTVTKREVSTGGETETWTQTKKLELWHRVKAAIDAPAPDGSPWRLIIIDPMVELIASGAENDSDAMAEALRHGVHALRQGTSATILVLHHNRKGGAGDGDDADAARGSSAIMGSMRWAAAIGRTKDGWVSVKVTKSNYTKKDTMVLQKWPDDGDAWLSPVTAEDFARVEEHTEKDKERPKAASNGGKTKAAKPNGPPPPAPPPPDTDGLW